MGKQTKKQPSHSQTWVALALALALTSPSPITSQEQNYESLLHLIKNPQQLVWWKYISISFKFEVGDDW